MAAKREVTSAAPTGTAKSVFFRPVGRAVAIGLGALAILGFAIGQAAAKSDISVTAVLTPVLTPALAPVPGHGSTATRLIDVTGRGSDDAARYQQLCVDRRIGNASWRKVDCAPVGFGVGGVVHVYLPFAGPGPESFRASLLRVRSAAGDSPVVDRVSRTVTVTPTAGELPRLAKLINRLLGYRPRLR